MPASLKPRFIWRYAPAAVLFASLFQACSISAQQLERKPDDWKISGALAALEDERRDVQREALEKLAELKDPGTIKNIAPRLKDPDEEIRAAAITALGAIGEESRAHAAKIAGFLKEGKESERLAAVSALGSMGAAAQDHVKDMAGLLKDTQKGLPREGIIGALGALAKVGWNYRPEVKDLLRKTIVEWSANTDPTYQSVREEAIEARGRIEAIDSDHLADHIAYLVGLLKGARTNDDSCTRQKAGIALCEIGGRAGQHLPDVVSLLDEESRCRADLVGAIGEIGVDAEGYASRVAALLDDPDQSIHGSAALALISMTQGELSGAQVAKIANLLGSDDPYIRNDAVSALSRVKRADWSVVKQMASSQSPPTRAAALIVLGRVEPTVIAQSRNVFPNFLTLNLAGLGLSNFTFGGLQCLQSGPIGGARHVEHTRCGGVESGFRRSGSGRISAGTGTTDQFRRRSGLHPSRRKPRNALRSTLGTDGRTRDEERFFRLVGLRRDQGQPSLPVRHAEPGAERVAGDHQYSKRLATAGCSAEVLLLRADLSSRLSGEAAETIPAAWLAATSIWMGI